MDDAKSASMGDDQKLTEVQSRVYRFLKESFYQTGSMPTLREICSHMKWKAVGSAQDVIAALIEKGWVLKDANKSRGLSLADSTGFRAVPVLGSAPAGVPTEAIESHEGDVTVPDFIRGPVFAVKVNGDSMKGAEIYDGDIAIVKQSATANNREIVVASVDGEVTIKRILFRGSNIWLQPENPRFKERKIEDSSFRILGRVIGVHRYWESF